MNSLSNPSMHKFLRALFVFIAFAMTVAGQHFGDYKVKIYEGPFKEPAWLVRVSENDYKDRDENLTYRLYVNFAGKYFVASHRCGQDCFDLSITDLVTGDDLNFSKRFKYSIDSATIGERKYKDLVLIKPESRLLIIQTYFRPHDFKGDRQCREESFELKDKSLIALHKKPRPCRDRSLETTTGYGFGPEQPSIVPDLSSFFPEISECEKSVGKLTYDQRQQISQFARYEKVIPEPKDGTVLVTTGNPIGADVHAGECVTIQFNINVPQLAPKVTKLELKISKPNKTLKKLERLSLGFHPPSPPPTPITIGGFEAYLRVGSRPDDYESLEPPLITIDVRFSKDNTATIAGYWTIEKIKLIAQSIDYSKLAAAMDESTTKFIAAYEP